jgi:hypothetical protein
VGIATWRRCGDGAHSAGQRRSPRQRHHRGGSVSDSASAWGLDSVLLSLSRQRGKCGLQLGVVAAVQATPGR